MHGPGGHQRGPGGPGDPHRCPGGSGFGGHHPLRWVVVGTVLLATVAAVDTFSP